MARLCTLTSPLGEDLEFARMRIAEAMSSLYSIELDAVSKKADIDPKALLGKSMSIKVAWEDGVKREFSGYATEFTVAAVEQNYFRYRITLRPWLWFLTRTADCKIFQEQTVPDIVKKVLDDEDAKVFETNLTGSYVPIEYCVQYRESDFNFVARLLEQEGIYWFFEHADGKHTLKLIDSKASHQSLSSPASLPFVPDQQQRTNLKDHVNSWLPAQQLLSGTYVLDEYDFKRPSAEMLVTRKPDHIPAHEKAGYEVFDYPGDYGKSNQGEQYVGARIEEIHTTHNQFQGSGPLRQMQVGRKFKLSGHGRSEQNTEYLITGTDYVFAEEQYRGGQGAGAQFSCSFRAIRAEQQYRPPRATPKPYVHGIQTAVVTGPAGEEIHTDEYGRIKVQFHWDRYGKKDEKTSCWMRVAFLAAGARFGFVSIPRIGHEVVVDFLEGDPDRPLVTGVVYNGANMPPWALPANKTQSGLYTRSSKGGGYDNANAIRFEDKKGAEQVWIHAEKNQDIEVENDETHWVGHDRKKNVDHDETVHVKHDRTEVVDNDETISIGRDRSMTIGRDKSEKVLRNKNIEVIANHKEDIGASMYVNVGGSLSESVTANYSETVGVAMEITVGAAMAITVGAAMAETVGGVKSENIGGTKTEVVGGNKSVNVGGDLSENVSKSVTSQIENDLKETIGGQHIVSVTKEHVLNAKKIQLVGADEIVLKCGSAELIMKKSGDISIKGNKISVKGSGDVVIKGSKVLEN